MATERLKRLNEDELRKLSVEPGKKETWFADAGPDRVKGLYVRVTTRGVKSFWYKWAIPRSAERPKLPIGQWGQITLKTARTEASKLAALVAAGGDPRTVRKEREEAYAAERAAKRLTLDSLIAHWEKRGLVDRRDSYRKDACPRLRRAFSNALNRPATHLARKEVIENVQRLHQAGKATTGRRVITYGRAMFNWAIRADLVQANPFLNLPFSKRERHRDRFLRDNELGAIYEAAGHRPYPAGPMVQLLMLTAQRLEEVAGMRWSEIAPDLSKWLIPASRAKNGAAHVVHLSEPARAIIRELALRPRLAMKGGKASDLVFTTTGTTSFSGFSRLKTRLDKDSGVSEPGWVFHDFRRTFSTRIVDPEFGVSESDADRVLNHVRTGVKRHYQMNERKVQRDQALRLWGDHVVKCASAQAVWVAARIAGNKAEADRKAREGAARSVAKRAARKAA